MRVVFASWGRHDNDRPDEDTGAADFGCRQSLGEQSHGISCNFTGSKLDDHIEVGLLTQVADIEDHYGVRIPCAARDWYSGAAVTNDLDKF